MLGCAYLGAGKVQPAIAELNEAVRLSPNYPDVDKNLGNALGMAGRKEDAVKTCGRPIELARNAGDGQSIERFAEQLRNYEAGKPLHFAK